MATYWHYTKRWDGKDLESLEVRLGSEEAAIKRYTRRWPDAGELALYHVNCIHLFATREDADNGHCGTLGAQLLEIEISEDDYIDVQIDTLEFPHPVVYGPIPANCVKRVYTRRKNGEWKEKK